MLVSLADHGLTPTVLAARLTYTGAPESLQGAVAAGLLGAGSVFLGVVEDTARFLDDDRATTWRARVARELEAGRRIPGLGHPVHKVQDPRTPRIYEIAEETGLLGLVSARAARARRRRTRRQTGRELPINGAGRGRGRAGRPRLPGRAPARLRAAGAHGGVARPPRGGDGAPIGMRLYREVDERAKYDPPTGE